MKIERTKNTIKGSIWGGVERIVNILLPFVVRTVLIKKLGAEYLGLSGLFTSVLQVLNLTELGFGSAAIYLMYKPVADDDYQAVGAILLYLKKVYKVIGLIMFIIGIMAVPLLPYIIEGDIPQDVNVVVLYIIYIFNTASSYFLFAYKSALLNALQCNDIISKVGFLTSTCLHVLQIGLLLLYPNYYIYTLLIPISTILNNVVKSYIVEKKYSQYLIEAPIDKSIKDELHKKIVPLISTKLAGVLINAADTIVISAFLGLKEVAIYNNYYYIINAIMGFLLVIYSAMQAGVGNSLVVDSHEKLMNLFNRLCFINTWLVTICTVCLLCLYQPFMQIWLGEKYLLPFGMVVLFSIYFYANSIQRIVVIYKDAAGIWKEDMLRCYLSCILNLIVNVVTVKSMGLYGVIGSSVVANIIGLPWMGYILYKTVFLESPKRFYMDELKGVGVAALICSICYIVCSWFPEGILWFLVRGITCFVLGNGLLFLAYGRTKGFSDARVWIGCSVLNRK